LLSRSETTWALPDLIGGVGFQGSFLGCGDLKPLLGKIDATDPPSITHETTILLPKTEIAARVRARPAIWGCGCNTNTENREGKGNEK
jgi:hypothetical protein